MFSERISRTWSRQPRDSKLWPQCPRHPGTQMMRLRRGHRHPSQHLSRRVTLTRAPPSYRRHPDHPPPWGVQQQFSLPCRIPNTAHPPALCGIGRKTSIYKTFRRTSKESEPRVLHVRIGVILHDAGADTAPGHTHGSTCTLEVTKRPSLRSASRSASDRGARARDESG